MPKSTFVINLKVDVTPTPKGVNSSATGSICATTVEGRSRCHPDTGQMTDTLSGCILHFFIWEWPLQYLAGGVQIFYSVQVYEALRVMTPR